MSDGYVALELAMKIARMETKRLRRAIERMKIKGRADNEEQHEDTIPCDDSQMQSDAEK